MTVTSITNVVTTSSTMPGTAEQQNHQNVQKNQGTTPHRQRNKAAPYLPSYMEEGQLCVVCGDQATGLHYRAITCEGCKGFWRRTEQRRLIYACKTGDEQCAIDKNTRNVCQRCRYIKCRAVGMSSDLVLNENERAHKRMLIKENRERRQIEQVLAQIRGPAPDPQRVKELYKVIDTVTRFYCAHVDRPIPPLDDTTLDDAQKYAEAIRPVVRRNKQFAEALKPFDELPMEAQCELLNASLLEVQVLRLISFFDSDKECFRPSAEVCIGADELIKLAGAELHSQARELIRVARAFDELQLDLRQMAVLSALFFFNPDNQIENSDLLSQTHEVLWDALKCLSDEDCDSLDPKRWCLLSCRVFELRALCCRLTPFLRPDNVAFFSKILSV